ncbi:hypothetical protein AAVH_05326 [Aphelenchoides avenae]|nr:hypothetical protein AAVH_05326 [Aphelenchus avenae]
MRLLLLVLGHAFVATLLIASVNAIHCYEGISKSANQTIDQTIDQTVDCEQAHNLTTNQCSTRVDTVDGQTITTKTCAVGPECDKPGYTCCTGDKCNGDNTAGSAGTSTPPVTPRGSAVTSTPPIPMLIAAIVSAVAALAN